MQGLLRDFSRSPWLSASALVVMTITIGINAAVVAVLSQVVLRPPPFADPHELFVAWGADTFEVRRGLDGRRLIGSQLASVSQYGVFQLTPRPLALSREGSTVDAILAGRNLLRVLGVAPILGPGFSANGEFEVMLSETVWRNNFGSDPDVLKQQLFFNGRPFIVKGVLPKGFAFPDYLVGAWLLLPETSPDLSQVQIIGRLRPGATIDQARTELSNLLRQESQASIGVFEISRLLLGNQGRVIWALYGVATLILMAGCASTAGLLLHDAISTCHEWALLVSLGCQRGRLIAGRLAYCAILCTTAALFGTLVAAVTLKLVRDQQLSDLPQVDVLKIDAPVIAYTLTVAVLAAGIAALGPAVIVSKLQPFRMLRVGSMATPGRFEAWLRGSLLSTQCFLTVVIVGVGLVLGSSLVNVLSINWGFVHENVVVSEVSIDASTIAKRPLAEVFDDTPLRAVRSVPSVESAAMAYGVPLRWFRWQPSQVRVDGEVLSTGIWTVTEDYFRTLGVRILKGREFLATDVLSSQRVCIVSRRFARAAWSETDPIGKTVSLLKLKEALYGQPREQILQAIRDDPSALEPNGDAWMVVGEVDEVRMFGLRDTTGPVVYVSMRQSPETPNPRAIVVTKMRDAADLGPIVRALKESSRFAVPVFRTESNFRMADELDRASGARGSTRLLTYTAILFAGISAILTGIGIYSVSALNVLYRRGELAIRLMLGATRFEIGKVALRAVILQALVGILVGAPVAILAVTAIRGLLFGVNANTPVFVILAALATGAIALIATTTPLMRALNIKGSDLFRVE